jgi:cytidylate kinase
LTKESIAIDGPAGAGKSTVAKRVAARLGFTYLDTGAMYRTVALLSLRENPSPGAEIAARVAREMNLRFEQGDPQRILVNGEDVTEAIRTPIVGEVASFLSTISEVRRELVRRQRTLCGDGRFVLEGRDTTTVVCPDARLKVYLTASVAERAKRRWLELQAKGDATPLQDIEAQIAERDHRDMTRADSPLRVAEDAVVIDTDDLSPEEVVEVVLAKWAVASPA